MKLKQQIGIGLALAVVYCVLAYIFMWPPIVRNYWVNHHHSKNFDFNESFNGKCCEIYLQKINQAIQGYARFNNKQASDPVTFSDLTPYIKSASVTEIRAAKIVLDSRETFTYKQIPEGQIPDCPCGGKYSVTHIGELPTCSLSTNKPYKVRMQYFYWEWTNLPVKLGYGHSLDPININWRELP